MIDMFSCLSVKGKGLDWLFLLPNSFRDEEVIFAYEETLLSP